MTQVQLLMVQAEKNSLLQSLQPQSANVCLPPHQSSLTFTQESFLYASSVLFPKFDSPLSVLLTP